jgi:hypothetical protein
VDCNRFFVCSGYTWLFREESPDLKKVAASWSPAQSTVTVPRPCRDMERGGRSERGEPGERGERRARPFPAARAREERAGSEGRGCTDDRSPFPAAAAARERK